jgi:Ran GTPase-activating protein (RanGAP) involved in mRNA processing and transport
MRYNKLDELKLKTITQALGQLTLKRLDLSFCHLDDMCGYPIALLLQTTNSLKELELEGNRLGKMAMQTIGFALETYNGPLVYLGLSKNVIGDDGILCLGGGVRDTENVQVLDLSDCEFTAIGAMRVGL